MITEIVYSLVNEGWKIYLRPSKAQSLDNINKTWGSRYDKIEGEKVIGGVPQKWLELPGLFSTKAEAEKAQKVF